MFESYNKGDKDFTAIVSRLKRDNIDLVYLGGYHQEGGLLMRQMRDQGLKTVLMAGDALNDKEFASITGPPPKACCSPSVPIRATRRPPRPWSTSSRRRTSIRKATRSTPTPRCRCGRRPPRRPTRTDAKKVAETIKGGTWDTVLGKLSFDAKGDIKVIDYVVYKFDAKGNYAEIIPARAHKRALVEIGI